MSLAIRGLLCKCRRQKPSARFSGGGGRNDQQSPPPTPFSWHLEASGAKVPYSKVRTLYSSADQCCSAPASQEY